MEDIKQRNDCSPTNDSDKFECDSCGKTYVFGIAIMIVYPIVFVCCEECCDLLPDDDSEAELIK